MLNTIYFFNLFYLAGYGRDCIVILVRLYLIIGWGFNRVIVISKPNTSPGHSAKATSAILVSTKLQACNCIVARTQLCSWWSLYKGCDDLALRQRTMPPSLTRMY